MSISATSWTVAHQASLSVKFSRQEYWSGLPFPSLEDLPDPGIEPKSPAFQADSLPSEPPGKPTTREATAMRSPCTATRQFSSPKLEEAHMQQRRSSRAKNNIFLKKIWYLVVFGGIRLPPIVVILVPCKWFLRGSV